jgi:hypothetical protein
LLYSCSILDITYDSWLNGYLDIEKLGKG